MQEQNTRGVTAASTAAQVDVLRFKASARGSRAQVARSLYPVIQLPFSAGMLVLK